MDAERTRPAAYRFDRFTLDLARGALLGPDGAAVPLRPKSFALLRLLVENTSRLLDRDAIMSAVWPDVVVTDELIAQCVHDIRKALGDEAQQVLKTVPKRGYLFAAEVLPAEPASAAPRAERRLAAILAADIVGYSRLVERDEAGTLAAIRTLREHAVDPLLAEHHGRIVKLMGDGAIVEFASVVDAVACAIAVQKAVAAHQATAPADRRIVFRIGVNLGDVVVDGDDLLGDGVNVAARLEQLCEPGGVLVSGTAYDHLQGRLGLPLEFTGEQQVKNITRPVQAYRVRLDGTAATRPRFARMPWRTAAAAMLAALAIIALVVFNQRSVEQPMRDARPGIAVLPFENLSGDEATGRLADGITEDIITDLARFRNLDVIARNSTAAYKGRHEDVRRIGRELSVGYVLEGSIQHQSDQVRVTAQLIDARTDAHRWSERWDRPIADLFAVQAEISEKVANALGGFTGLIVASDRIAAKRKRPEDLAAYELYLLGLEKKHGLTSEEASEAITRLKQAIALDPTLARAWAGLAHAYMGAADWMENPSELQRASADAASRAIELDPLDAEAHAVYGMALGLLGELGRAEAEFDQAMLLNPASAEVLIWYAGWGSSVDKPALGAEAAERAIRLNPSYPGWAATTLRYAFFMAGHYDEALRVLARKPEEGRYDQDKIEEACSLVGLGRLEEARAVAAQTMVKFPYISVERHVSRPDFIEHERRRYLELMPQAGFPACATEDQLARFEKPVRLPDCEKRRAMAAGSESGSLSALPAAAPR